MLLLLQQVVDERIRRRGDAVGVSRAKRNRKRRDFTRGRAVGHVVWLGSRLLEFQMMVEDAG